MEALWQLEDHLCKKCGGRILKSVSGFDLNASEEHLFRCADCGNSAYGDSPDVICWCGMKHRLQDYSVFRCQSYSILNERPELLDSFKDCGCDPDNGGEVGVMMAKDLGDVAEETEKQEPAGVIWLI